MGSEEIPDFPPIFGESEVRPKAWCRHERVMLHEQTRTVQCRNCKEAVDPFDILLQQANGERYVESQKARLREMHDKLAELHAEEKRVKARTRNASRKDAKKAVDDARRLWEDRHHRAAYRVAEIKRLADSVLRNLQADPGRPPEEEARRGE